VVIDLPKIEILLVQKLALQAKLQGGFQKKNHLGFGQMLRKPSEMLVEQFGLRHGDQSKPMVKART
jgi:hypothetical protein